jgi:predicted lipid-binding transport protein (Tim44 family)
MRKPFLSVILTLTFLFAGSKVAQAYIDPGTGGYLIGSAFAMIGGFFALASALVIHLFRNIIGGWAKALWKKFGAFLPIAALLAAAAGIWAFLAFGAPSAHRSGPADTGVRVKDAAAVTK